MNGEKPVSGIMEVSVRMPTFSNDCFTGQYLEHLMGKT